MRSRRGNYSLFFAMLLPILLGFLALAIDIGRLRVARVQIQGAADAAALAALAELRAGNSQGDAEAAAEDAANATRMQSVAAGGNLFDVQVNFGDWDFPGQAWSDRGGSINGVTVQVEQNRPLGLLFAPVFEAGGFARTVYQGGLEGNGAIERSLSTVRRASLRPRDIVIVLDVSRNVVDHLDGLHDAAEDLIDVINDFRMPEDRVAIVEFAGAAVVRAPLTRVADDYADLRAALASYGPCGYDSASWFYYYRFFDWVSSEESRGEAGVWQFNPFTNHTIPSMPTQYAFEPGGPSDLLVQETLSDAGLDPVLEDELYADLTDDQRCVVFWTSQFIHLNFDHSTGELADENNSELMCYEGHVLTESQGWDDTIGVPELVGCHENFAMPVPIDGIAEGDYGGSDDGDPNWEYANFSYQEAGVNPGAGLALARDILAAAQPSRGEPTVILITTAGPRSGPDVDDVHDAEEVYAQATVDAVLDLEADEVNLHVLSIVDGGSPDDDFLSSLPIGRGLYRTTDDVRDAADLIDEIARDIRIQVVQ